MRQQLPLGRGAEVASLTKFESRTVGQTNLLL